MTNMAYPVDELSVYQLTLDWLQRRKPRLPFHPDQGRARWPTRLPCTMSPRFCEEDFYPPHHYDLLGKVYTSRAKSTTACDHTLTYLSATFLPIWLWMMSHSWNKWNSDIYYMFFFYSVCQCLNHRKISLVVYFIEMPYHNEHKRDTRFMNTLKFIYSAQASITYYKIDELLYWHASNILDHR